MVSLSIYLSLRISTTVLTSAPGLSQSHISITSISGSFPELPGLLQYFSPLEHPTFLSESSLNLLTMTRFCAIFPPIFFVFIGAGIGFIIGTFLLGSDWKDRPEADSTKRALLVAPTIGGATLALAAVLFGEGKKRQDAARRRRQPSTTWPTAIGKVPYDPTAARVLTCIMEALPQITTQNTDLEAQIMSKNCNVLVRPDDPTPLPAYTASGLESPQAPPPTYSLSGRPNKST